jgi:hypothetical protein
VSWPGKAHVDGGGDNRFSFTGKTAKRLDLFSCHAGKEATTSAASIGATTLAVDCHSPHSDKAAMQPAPTTANAEKRFATIRMLKANDRSSASVVITK